MCKVPYCWTLKIKACFSGVQTDLYCLVSNTYTKRIHQFSLESAGGVTLCSLSKCTIDPLLSLCFTLTFIHKACKQNVWGLSMMILPVVVNLIANPLQVDCPRNDDIILNAHIFFDWCLQINSVVYFEICLK